MSLESSHYYDIHGNPCHTQPCVSKNAKKPTRATNIDDAERLGLFPSVTGITKALDNPGLERHKLLQVAKTCYNHPPSSDKEITTYANEMIKVAEQDAGGAAKIGDLIHEALENYITNPEYDLSTPIDMQDGNTIPAKEFVIPAIERMKELHINVLHSEKVVVNAPDGYAGKVDVIGEMRTFDGNWNVISDYKSTRTKPDKKIAHYPDRPMQIAAYLKAYFGTFEKARGINIFISTTEIGRVEHTIYEEAQLREAWEAFQCCCSLYRYTKKFDPRRPNLS
jgi:hypothetical protein